MGVMVKYVTQITMEMILAHQKIQNFNLTYTKQVYCQINSIPVPLF